jgi:signal peptidase I
MLMRKSWQRLILAVAVISIAQVACGQQPKRLRQNGYSMKPNIMDGDVLRVEEVPLTDLTRGDFIVVEINGDLLVKRLIGLPNETISLRDGTVFINGSIFDEPYEVVPSTDTMDEVRLDDDSYFVLGDNRPDSLDSRQLGPIKSDAIKGQAILE